MISAYLSLYKDYVFLAIIIVYSLGLWHVSSRYTSSKYLNEQLKQSALILELKTHDQVLANTLGKQLEDGFANMKIVNTTINRDIHHETTTHKFYTTCVNTPDVVRNIEATIDNRNKPTSK